jgi:hypothetical protein
MLSSIIVVMGLKLMKTLQDTILRGAGTDSNHHGGRSLFFVRLFELLVDIPQLNAEGLTESPHVF